MICQIQLFFHYHLGRHITPSPSPRMIAFKICITPLLAPSVRNMSSWSLSLGQRKAISTRSLTPQDQINNFIDSKRNKKKFISGNHHLG